MLIRYRLWPMVMSGIIFYLLYQFAYNPYAHSILGLFIVSWIPLWWHMVNHFIRAWKYRGELGTAEKLIRYQTVRDFAGIYLFFLVIGWILKIVSGVFLGVIGMVYTVIQLLVAIFQFFASRERNFDRA